MLKAQERQIEKGITRLRADYGAAVVNQRLREEMQERVRVVMVSSGLNRLATLNYLINQCTEWAKQKQPKIKFTEITDAEQQRILGKLVTVLTPKVFAELIAPLRVEESQQELHDTLTVLFKGKKVGYDYVIKQSTRAARDNLIPKFTKVNDQKIRTQLQELIEKYGGGAVAAQAQELRDTSIRNEIKHWVDQLHIHGGYLYHDAVAAVHEKFRGKKQNQENSMR